jgi:UDP-glucose:(heptosyl)LPS alpha-1,3-glucosyltransferase
MRGVKDIHSAAGSPERDPLLEAEYRDPFGHMLHVAIACGALFLAPLGIVPSEIGLWTLLAVCLIRLPSLARTLPGMLAWPITPWLVASVCLVLISLVWSTDQGNGAMRLKCLRALLWAVCLWPIAGDPWARRWLVRGILAGISALVATQLAARLVNVASSLQWVSSRPGGLHGEESKAALWCATGLCLALGGAASAQVAPRIRISAMIFSAATVTGLCLSGSLRVIAASALALVATPCVAALCQVRVRSTFLIVCLAASVMLVIGVSIVPEVRERAIDEARSVLRSGDEANPFATELQRRLLWWRAEWDGFLEDPIIASGWGSTPTLVRESGVVAASVARLPAIADDTDLVAPGQPHSLYMMVLGELGVPGALLLLMCIWSTVLMALRAVRESSLNLGVLAALIMWMVAAAGDTVTNSTNVAIFAILAVMTARPSPSRRPAQCPQVGPTRLRVAVFVERFGFPGGSERFSQQTVNLMADTGRYEFHVFANRWNSTRTDIRFYHVPIARFSRTLRPWLLSQIASQMIRRGTYDVVHSHGAIAHADIVSVHGAPRRYWIREVKRRRMHPFDFVSDAVDRAVLSNGSSTRFMPVSSLLHDTFRETWGTLPGSWAVLHPGVDCDRFARNEEARAAQRARLGISNDEIMLLFVGMNFEIKGLGLLIEALAQYSRTPAAVPMKIVVVGKGKEDHFRGLARSLGIEDKVTFAGVCTTGIENYYSAADAFALLSTFETFCMAALEAMAASLPVIVTSRMGIRDLVVDGEHGFVVAPDAQVRDVVRCLHEIADGSKRTAMGRRARGVAEQHSWEVVVRRLGTEYEASAASKQGKAPLSGGG